MKLQIERPYADAMLEQFPDLTTLKEQLRFGNRAEIAFTQLSGQELSFLHDIYHQAGPAMQGRAAQISTLQTTMNDAGERYCADDLELLMPAIAEYLLRDGMRGWLFKANTTGKPIAYVITRLDYTPPGEEEAGRILIELKANSRGKIAIENIVIRSRDIVDRTISEIFINKGYLKETRELIRSYDESSDRYFAWRAEYGKQFSARGVGHYAEDPTASHRNTDWSRKNTVVLSSTGADARLVNDENIISSRALGFEGSGEILRGYLRKAGKSMRYDEKVEKGEVIALLIERKNASLIVIKLTK